ncbi:MAG: hypothetical protein ACTSPD_12840, partial [Promethearchaeota archaeon]
DFSYSYDGTPPEDVDFQCNIESLSTSIGNLNRPGGSMTYEQSSRIIVRLYNPSYTRSQLLVDETKSKTTFNEWKYANNIQSFFTEGGTYHLRVTIDTDLDIDCDYVERYRSSSGTCVLDYSYMGNSGAANVRYRVRADSFRFDIDEEKPYTTGDCYLQTSINFDQRYVKLSPTPRLEFDYSIQNELIDNQESSTFHNGKIRATMIYHYASGPDNSEYEEWDIITGVSAHASWALDTSKLNQSLTIDVRIGIHINSGFEIEYGSGGGWARIMFANPYMYLETVPKPGDVNLYLQWKGDEAGGQIFPSGVNGAGTLVITPTLLDLTKDKNIDFYFISTSQKLSFNYEHELIATFENFTLTSIVRVTNGSSTVHFDVKFDWNVPNEKASLKNGRDYSDSFEFNLTFPRWVQGGEPYWDMDQAHLTSGIYQESASVTEVDTGNWQETQIYVMEDTPYVSGATYTDTQIAQVDNDLFDEYLLVNSFHQEWDFNFSAPNLLNKLIMDDNNDFGSPTYTLLTGNVSNVRLEHTASVSSGSAGIKWVNKSEVHQAHSINNSLSGTFTPFKDTNGWDTTGATLGDYYVIGNYTDTHAGKSMPGSMQGINRFGYTYRPFSVAQDTYIEYLTITPKIYDTRVNGKNGDLIVIELKWSEKGGTTGIPSGNVKINIGQFEISAGDIKEPVIPAEWYQKDMIDKGGGVYKINIDPTFYGHAGNITWGFHNFTISLQREGYLSQTVKENFTIIVDSVLRIIDPPRDNVDPIYNHPHFKYGIMGGNQTGLSEYLTTFSCYYYENLSTPTYFTNNPGNPYRNQVEISYVCLNYTRGQLGWWNWTWNKDQGFDAGKGGNPINGTFKSSGTEWQATIYLPIKSDKNTKEAQYFKNIVEYDSGIYLEYNVTARILRNESYPAPPGEGWRFQPNMVREQSCEDGYEVGKGTFDTFREETILIKLIKPQEGNFTRVVVLNDESADGTGFAMGTYNNDSSHNYENPMYILRQHYYNSTNGVHGRPNNEFRIRVLFNCTHAVRESATILSYPPCGPLNATNSNIVLTGWEQDPITLTADPTYLWHCNVLDNSTQPAVMKTFYGVTYTTPWLNFNDKPSGEYDLYIQASKNGYIDSNARIRVIILDQITEVLDKDSNQVSAEGVDNPMMEDIPYGNTFNITITYNDITNPVKDPIEGAEINCKSDNLDGYDNPFYNNQSITGKSTWRWRDETNGVYRIFIDYTLFENYIDKDIAQMALITFQIDAQNYSMREFKLLLNITKRQIDINLLNWNNISVYSGSEYFKILQLITFQYEIVDLDNKSAPVDFDIDPFTKKCSSFSFYYWNNSVPLSLFDYAVVLKYWDGPQLKYNITFNTQNIPVGDYNIMFRIEHNIYYTVSFNTTFRILRAPFHLNYLDNRSVIEYLPTILTPKLTTLPYQPYFEVKLIDTVHSNIFGYDYVVDYTGMSINIVPGNYSTIQTRYNEFGFLTSPEVSSSLDLAVYAGTSGDGTLKIYIDAQKVNVSAGLYYVNLSFSKRNYETTYEVVGFQIINASTSLEGDYILFAYQEGPITDKVTFPSSTNKYYEGDYKIIPWNKSVGIRFTYISDTLNTKISDDIEEVLQVHYSIKGFTSTQPWPEFINISIFTDLGTGIHYLQFTTNISATGTVDVTFNFSLWAPNFDPVSFPINITIRDRYTTYKNITISNDIYWTEKASLVIQYLDDDYYQTGIIKEPIRKAEVNGAINGTLNFGGGETAWWEVQEFTADAKANLPRRYQIDIKTDKLKVGKNYTVIFQIAKDHYESQSITFRFHLSPVPIKVNATVRPDDGNPSEEFQADEIEKIFIYVSVFVQLKNGTGDAEVNIDIMLPDINVSYILRRGDVIIHKGRLYWDVTSQKFKANFTAEDEEGDSLTGVYSLYIIVDPKDPNIQGKTIEIKILGIGVGEEVIPSWFWILLAIVIGAALAMAGYTVRKALYLRIPFVLRKIDETTKKIEKDKYPPVGVMTGRDEFIINSVINYLELCGIEWEREDKFEIKKVGEAAAKEKLPPLKVEEIEQELAKIGTLAKEEIVLFIDELKRLDREAQEEFLASLRGDVEKGSEE